MSRNSFFVRTATVVVALPVFFVLIFVLPYYNHLVMNLSAVVVTEGVSPDPETIHKAQETGIPLLTTAQDTFSVVAALAALGITANA